MAACLMCDPRVVERKEQNDGMAIGPGKWLPMDAGVLPSGDPRGLYSWQCLSLPSQLCLQSSNERGHPREGTHRVAFTSVFCGLHRSR